MTKITGKSDLKINGESVDINSCELDFSSGDKHLTVYAEISADKIIKIARKEIDKINESMTKKQKLEMAFGGMFEFVVKDPEYKE